MAEPEPISVQYYEIEGTGLTLFLDYCGEEVAVEVQEDAQKVEIQATTRDPAGDSGENCGAVRTVQLERPLDERAVIEVPSGEQIRTAPP